MFLIVIRRARSRSAPASSPPPAPSALGRRALLTGGVAAVGGALVASATGTGEAMAAPAAPAAPVTAPPGAVTLTLQGADWRLAAEPPPVQTGGSPQPPTALTTVGRFVDNSGNTIGSFRSTPLATGADGPDLHILSLDDGLILALGSGPLDEAQFAIVGGTGSYLGATGGYTARQSPTGPGGTGTALFFLTLLFAEQRPQTALGAAPATSARS
jgi:hypothetical protein